MKKLILSTFGLAASIGAFAQLPVSTNPENKNVILEEFTGIYCTWCPAGHLDAANKKAANPDDLFLINVHTGGYAAPSGNDPDFRTPFGSALATLSGLQGYPAATMSRRATVNLSGSPAAFPNTDMNTLMSESSYVNVAFEASLDVSTRELTVNLEAYFTADGPASVNINVALLQDHIEGPQTGAASRNPGQILPNGNYDHMHALRHLLTGQWGEVITTTTTGTTVTKEYTYTIPADLNGITYELGDLHLVAFISEGQGEIITGQDGPLSLIIPPGIKDVDLSATTAMSVPTNWCTSSVTPEITVTNNSSTIQCDSFDISYSVNGGAPVTLQIATPANPTLAAGASATFPFPSITLPSGENDIVFTVSTTNNTTYVDMSTGNNSAAQSITVIPSTAFATTFTENFELSSSPSNAIEIVDGASEDNVWPIKLSHTNGQASAALGAYTNSETSYFWDFYSITSGGEASIVWEKVDLSTTTGNNLSFDHAYAQYSTENDRLQFFVSTDCGSTWSTIFNKAGSTLSTRTPVGNDTRFFPTATEWRTTNVDLSAYDGETELMLKMTGTSDYGNCLFVDNINVSTTIVGINEDVLNNSLSIYPNPTQSTSTISFNLTETATVGMEVYNAMGSLVHTKSTETLHSGEHQLVFDGADLPKGIYFVNLTIGNQLITKKVSLLK